MKPYITYVNAGRIEEIKKRGCLKTSMLDRYIMICYFDGEFLAVDMGSASEILNNRAVSADLRGMISAFMGSPREAFDNNWGKLIIYPVRLEGENVFVGSNPI